MGLFDRLFGKNAETPKPKQENIDPSWKNVLLPINRFEKATGISLEMSHEQPLSPETARELYKEASSKVIAQIPELKEAFNNSWSSVGDVNIALFRKGIQNKDTQKKFELLEHLFKLKSLLEAESEFQETAREPKIVPIKKLETAPEKKEREYNGLRSSAKNFLATAERLSKSHPELEKINDLRSALSTLIAAANPVTLELKPETKSKLLAVVNELYTTITNKDLEKTIQEQQNAPEYENMDAIPPQSDTEMLDTNAALLLLKINNLNE